MRNTLIALVVSIPFLAINASAQCFDDLQAMYDSCQSTCDSNFPMCVVPDAPLDPPECEQPPADPPEEPECDAPDPVDPVDAFANYLLELAANCDSSESMSRREAGAYKQLIKGMSRLGLIERDVAKTARRALSKHCK